MAARSQIPGTDRSQSGSAIVNEARQRLARLLHVQPADLVFGPNTTYGLNICMHGLNWRAGDNVVVPKRGGTAPATGRSRTTGAK